MATFKYDPTQWDDGEIIPTTLVHPVHQTLLGEFVQVEHLYAFPKGKASTHARLMRVYRTWEREPTPQQMWVPKQGYKDNLWNGVALNGQEDLLLLPLAKRLEFSKRLATRIAALAIILCPPAQVKTFTTWEEVLVAVTASLTGYVKNKVSKELTGTEAKDWQYVSNRHVPHMYRYNRVYQATGMPIYATYSKTDLALSMISRSMYQKMVQTHVDTLTWQTMGRLTPNHALPYLHMSLPGIWESIPIYGVKPSTARWLGYWTTQEGVDNVLRGGSTSALEVIPSTEEVEYFNSSWNDAGGFVFLPGGDEAHAGEVLKTVSHPNWCTSKDMGAYYRTSPFLVVMEDDYPAIAVRWFKDGEHDAPTVAEIQGELNNGVVTPSMQATLASRVIPYLDEDHAHALCAYLDNVPVTKDWVTDPRSLEELVAEFNSTCDSNFHITSDLKMWEVSDSMYIGNDMPRTDESDYVAASLAMEESELITHLFTDPDNN